MQRPLCSCGEQGVQRRLPMPVHGRQPCQIGQLEGEDPLPSGPLIPPDFDELLETKKREFYHEQTFYHTGIWTNLLMQ